MHPNDSECMFVSGRMDKVSDGSRAQSLGTYRTPRSLVDAAHEPLARAALDPHLDDHSHALGRRLGLVWTWVLIACVWRSTAICRCRCGRSRSPSRYFSIQSAEEAEPAAAALP